MDNKCLKNEGKTVSSSHPPRSSSDESAFEEVKYEKEIAAEK